MADAKARGLKLENFAPLSIAWIGSKVKVEAAVEVVPLNWHRLTWRGQLFADNQFAWRWARNWPGFAQFCSQPGGQHREASRVELAGGQEEARHCWRRRREARFACFAYEFHFHHFGIWRLHKARSVKSC